jgi:hypothetical protein
MSNDIMKVSKNDVLSVDEYSRKVAEQNRKLALLRKKQLYSNLKSATELRIDTARNIKKWIDILSAKIFSPEAMEKMDISRAIQLFKYVNNINLKVLADSNRLEEILGKYLQAGLLDSVDDHGEVKTSSNDDIKNEVLTKLRKLVSLDTSGDVIDAEPVVEGSGNINPEKTNDEDLKILQEAEKAIDDNLESDSETIPNPFDDEDDDSDDGTSVDFDFDDED